MVVSIGGHTYRQPKAIKRSRNSSSLATDPDEDEEETAEETHDETTLQEAKREAEIGRADERLEHVVEVGHLTQTSVLRSEKNRKK